MGSATRAQERSPHVAPSPLLPGQREPVSATTEPTLQTRVLGDLSWFLLGWGRSDNRMEESMRSKNWLFMCAAIASLVLLAGQAVAQQAPNPLAPEWSQKLPATQRFALVFDGQAVLDKETGLVWQRFLSDSLLTWEGARVQCSYEDTGGRLGWHLPTVEQLTSLVDMSRPADDIKLPVGHPFVGVATGTSDPADFYWAATPYPGVPGFALTLNFLIGVMSLGGCGVGVNGCYMRYWCVRGGQFYVAW